jgi:hypothetical protein
MRLKTVLPAFVLLVVGCNESVFDIDSKTSAVYTGLSLKSPHTVLREYSQLDWA